MRDGSPARTILVGYDGSDVSRRALDAAADLVGYGSSLAVVSVTPRRDDDTIEGSVDVAGVRRGERLLAEARERLHSRNVTARYIGPIGEPAEKLIDTAHDIGADLVVVGRRDQNALQRLVLGSVSSRVVRRARCDVLVVR